MKQYYCSDNKILHSQLTSQATEYTKFDVNQRSDYVTALYSLTFYFDKTYSTTFVELGRVFQEIKLANNRVDSDVFFTFWL